MPDQEAAGIADCVAVVADALRRHYDQPYPVEASREIDAAVALQALLDAGWELIPPLALQRALALDLDMSGFNFPEDVVCPKCQPENWASRWRAQRFRSYQAAVAALKRELGR